MCLESSSLCLFNIFINHLGHACLSNLWVALVCRGRRYCDWQDQSRRTMDQSQPMKLKIESPEFWSSYQLGKTGRRETGPTKVPLCLCIQGPLNVQLCQGACGQYWHSWLYPGPGFWPWLWGFTYSKCSRAYWAWRGGAILMLTGG